METNTQNNIILDNDQIQEEKTEVSESETDSIKSNEDVAQDIPSNEDGAQDMPSNKDVAQDIPSNEDGAQDMPSNKDGAQDIPSNEDETDSPKLSESEANGVLSNTKDTDDSLDNKSNSVIDNSENEITDSGYFVFNPETKTIIGYSSDVNAPKNIVIPQSINDIEVLHIGDNAFAGCQLTSVEFNNNLQTIGNNAFYNNPAMYGALTIPDSVTSIGAGAFIGCSGITQLNLGNGLKSIGEGAFYECGSVTGVINIADSVENIGNNAFYKCGGITQLNLGNGLKSIGEGAFYECGSITGVINIADSVESIGNNAFYKCSGITQLNLGNGLTNIGASVFSDCINLYGTITIPDSVVNIDNNAFNNCQNITSVNIGSGINTIDTYAFSGCRNLTEIYVDKPEDSVSGKPWGARYASVYWRETVEIYPYVIDISTGTITKYIGTDPVTNLQIPSEITYNGQNYAINAIGDYAFYANTNITGTLTIPNSVKIIGNSAFQDCTGITGTLTLPNGVVNIGNSAFQGCTGITGTLTLPNSVESIGSSAFTSCTGITGTLSIPDSVKQMGDSAFAGCSQISQLNIGAGLTEIASSAFFECSGITGVLTIPNNIKEISYSSFSHCSQIEQVNIGNGITSIGDAFSGCNKISEIYIDKPEDSVSGKPWGTLNASIYWQGTIKVYPYIINTTSGAITKYIGTETADDLQIPSEVEYIGEKYTIKSIDVGAFESKQNLTGTVTIPDTITNIGDYAFDFCTNIKTLVLGDSIINIGKNAFASCGISGHLVIPDSVVNIGDYAFSYCNKINKLTLGNGVENIGYGSFFECNNIGGMLTIPDNVKVIGYGAFNSCRNITQLDIGDGVTSIETYAFANCKNISQISFGNSIKNIGDFAFLACNGISGVITIPESVEIIDYSAFQSCENITQVNIGSNVNTINEDVFKGCTNLSEIFIDKPEDSISGKPWGAPNTSVYWQGTVKIYPYVVNINSGTIEKYVGTELVENLEIPSNVTYEGQKYTINSIAENAFKNKTNITGTVTIPNTVTEIGHGAFTGCSGITKVIISDGVTVIPENIFNGCTSLKDVNLGKGTQSIAKNAFANCTSVETILIPVPKFSLGLETIKEQPWGAPQTAKVLYYGEYVVFTDNISVINGEYARNINIFAEIQVSNIIRIRLPNNREISVGAKRWPSQGDYVYKVTDNGSYKFLGYDANGTESEYIVSITDIGLPTLTVGSETITILKTELSDLQTDNDLLEKIEVKATTIEKGDDFSGGTITLAPGDLEKVKNLQNDGESVQVTVTAASPTGLTDQKTVTVTLSTLSPKTVSYVANGGTPVPKNQEVEVGALLEEPETMTKIGYTFDGWYSSEDFQTGTKWNFASNRMPNNDIILYAKWNPRTDILYKVEHYIQELNGEYSIYRTEEFEGTTGTTVNANAVSITGFTYDPTNPSRVESGIVAGDGSLVLKVYYTRNKYNVTYHLGDGEFTSAVENTYVYGVGMTLPRPESTRLGYVFENWYEDASFTTSPVENIGASESGDKEYWAKYVPDPNTAYKVEYYYEKLDSSGFELYRTQVKYGEAFSNIVYTPTADDIIGAKFDETNADNVLSGTINPDPDNMLVLKVYFLRKSYTVTYETFGNKPTTESVMLKFGQLVPRPNTPLKDGYTCIHWILDGKVWNFDKDTMPARDITLNAVFDANRYDVVFWDWDGSIIYSNNLPYGEKLNTPPDPVRKGYKFIGWSPKVPETVPDYSVYFTAVYEKVGNGQTDNETSKDESFTVKFVDYDGSIISEQTVKYDQSAVEPEHPTREGYTFKCWDKSFENVTADLVVEAVYEKDSETQPDKDKTEGNDKDDNDQSASGEISGNNHKNCVLHWILFIISGVLILIMVKKEYDYKNKKKGDKNVG